MALSRKFLAALDIPAEKIDEIIKAHSDTVEALKEERDLFKEKAEKFDKIQKDLEVANQKIEDLSKDNTYKVKYDALKEDFDEYKKNVETEKTNNSKSAAYKQLLKEIGISEKRIDAVARLAELDKIKLDKDGKIEGSEELKKSLSEEWADFITKDGKEGAGISTPPGNGGGIMKTREEIMKIKDTQERQKAWGEFIKQGGN
jgi:predicted RNase H-like nuclease (RuvC/YqgF family)